MVAYHEHYHNTGVVIAGFVLQSMGFAFLISASLQLLARAIQVAPADGAPPAKQIRVIRLLQIPSLIALVLMIIGYQFVPDNAWSGASVTLPAEIKVSSLIFCGLVMVIIALDLIHLTSKVPPSFMGGMQPQDTTRGEPRLILICVLLASLPMAIRAVYSAVLMFTSNPFTAAPITRAILEYAMEALVMLIYLAMAIILHFNIAGLSSTGGPVAYGLVEEGHALPLPESASPACVPALLQTMPEGSHTYPPSTALPKPLISISESHKG